MALSDAASSAVAAWTLDEASSTRFDQVGSNDLTDNNTVLSATGKHDDGADFEEDDSTYLSRVDNTDLSSGDVDFMICAWIKQESGSTTQGIVAKWTSGTSREFKLNVQTNNKLRFECRNGGTAAQADWGTAISTGTWYLVHAWHDSVANVIGIAVDAGTAVTTSFSGGPQDGTGQFTIGALGAPGSYFDGIIDDVVYLKGYILDATERSEHYNSGSGVPYADWAADVSSSSASSSSSVSSSSISSSSVSSSSSASSSSVSSSS
jgi:hypothetical protein